MGIAGARSSLVAAAIAALIISPAMFGLWGAKLERRTYGVARRPRAAGTASPTR